MICKRLHPGLFSICVGDGLRHHEEIVKISNRIFQCDYDDDDYYYDYDYYYVQCCSLLVVPSFSVSSCCLLGPFPHLVCDRLVGLVVRESTSRAEDLGFESHLNWDFSGSSHTSDLKIGTPVASLPGTWHYRVSAGTGQPGVSILWQGEMESLICNFCLSMAACTIEQIWSWDTLACCWDVR